MMVMAVPRMEKSASVRERGISPNKSHLPKRKPINPNMIMQISKPSRRGSSTASNESLQSTSAQLPRIGIVPFARKLSNLSIGSSDSAASMLSSAARKLARKGSVWSRAAGGHKAKRIPPKKFFQNTYKIEPDDGTLFNPTKVRQMLESTLEHYLHDKTYEHQTSKVLSSKISEVIRHRVKSMEFRRYKIVVNVVIGELRNQGLKMVSRCVWNSSTDNFASATYKNSSLFAITTVFAVYFE
ncbi:dynein light chain Tctex-type 5-like [Ptychodera flava]|uniref:dynein light chain Tctex-type 5-like n=1 Tax=Ptychodera flava TaxID=63121 RepID=UPI00396A6D94